MIDSRKIVEFTRAEMNWIVPLSTMIIRAFRGARREEGEGGPLPHRWGSP